MISKQKSGLDSSTGQRPKTPESSLLWKKNWKKKNDVATLDWPSQSPEDEAAQKKSVRGETIISADSFYMAKIGDWTTY